MNMLLSLEEQPEEQCQNKSTPSSKQDSLVKTQEETATKKKVTHLTQSQHIRIRNELFAMFKHPTLKGKIKVQDFDNLSEVEITLYHKIKNYSVQQNVRILFSRDYPFEAPKLQIHSCNLRLIHAQYIIPNFLAQNQLLTKQRWDDTIQLCDVLGSVMQTLQDFHASQIQRLFERSQQKQEQMDSCHNMKQEQQDENSIEKTLTKHRRKSSNMTGCADKELTQTKNLNRHFRSKLREVLRDLVSSPEEETEDYTFIDTIFTPNRVGFEDIRKALSNKWFNNAVRKQMNSGQFLHKILRGMMGIKSKKLMIKYYHVMACAVEQPNSFTRWKYD